MKKTTQKIIFLTLVVFCFSFVFGAKALAVEEEKKSTGPSVSPPIINLDIQQGETKNSSFAYTNNSDSDQVISIDLRPFVPSNGEKGSPVFTDEDGKMVASPLKDWIELDKDSYEVAKNSSTTIGFSVNVPSGADAKKYYVALVAGEKKSDQELKGSTISTEIGVLLVANVQKATLSAESSRAYPWYFYAMLVALILAIIFAVVIYFRKD